MARATKTLKETRIQREKKKQILDAALAVFSAQGFRGATIDQIAEAAGISKPNILYYFDSKQEIHQILLQTILDVWLEPLEAIDADGDPVDEILTYVHCKLELAADLPQESRLFAFEVMRGAEGIFPSLEGGLRSLVDRKVAVIQDWIEAGRLAPVDPRHLFFTIWATTQHYSDFEVQVEAVCNDQDRTARFETAHKHLDTSFRRMLSP